MRNLKRWGVAVIAASALALGCFGEFPTVSGGSLSPQAAQAATAAPAPDVNCGDTCGGGGGQTCYFQNAIAPNYYQWFISGCGANNWRQIHVYVDLQGHNSCGNGVVSAGLGYTGAQAWRCSSGWADAYDPNGHYQAGFLYNTTPFWAIVTGYLIT